MTIRQQILDLSAKGYTRREIISALAAIGHNPESVRTTAFYLGIVDNEPPLPPERDPESEAHQELGIRRVDLYELALGKTLDEVLKESKEPGGWVRKELRSMRTVMKADKEGRYRRVEDKDLNGKPTRQAMKKAHRSRAERQGNPVGA
jgi:hypothetical protein